MKELPVEVLHLIFTQLPLVEKQGCMFVCLRWAHILSTLSLFHTVAIQNEPKFGRFLHYMEQSKKLVSLFPNLESIELSSVFVRGRSSTMAFNRGESQTTATLSNKHLKTIKDESLFNLSRLVINENLCSQLVTLSLNGYYIPESPEHIFNVLISAPALKNLVAIGFQLSIDLLETLHMNTPLLESLDLFNVDFVQSDLPGNIELCTTLTTLNVKPYYHRTHNFATSWLDYICTKYTQLEHFKTDFCIANVLARWEEAYQTHIPLLLHNCSTSLQSFTYSHKLDTSKQVLAATNLHHCQFKKLEVLAEKNTRVLNDIASLDHFTHIQHLMLTDIPSESTLKSLKDMHFLQSLSLKYAPVQVSYVGGKYVVSAIDIINLFNCFPPSLESLVLELAPLCFDSSYASTRVYQIKQLTLADVRMKVHEINQIVSHCLPNTTSLNFTNVFKRLNETFDLPNHHLSDLDIALGPNLMGGYEISVCIITKDRRRPRYYTCRKALDKGHSELCSYILPVSFTDLEGKSFLTFSCASVDSVRFLGSTFIWLMMNKTIKP